MAYVTDGSSNTVTNGSALNIEIKISNDPVSDILLKGKITIDHLDKIATGTNLENLSCELFGQSSDAGIQPTTPVKICSFPFDANSPGNRKFLLPRDFEDEYVYLLFKINSAKCTIATLTADLNIGFKDENGSGDAIDLPFEVVSLQVKPEILSYSANPSVLQGNNAPTNLNWEIKGENYTYRILDGLKELKTGNEANDSGKFEINPVPIGNHSYTLEVTQGSATVTKSIPVRALDQSNFSFKGNPPLPLIIGNFCAGQQDDYLFSLMYSSNNQTGASIDSIGYTHEGLSGNWSKISLSDSEKERLLPYATSPMVHLRGPGEVYGRLFFVGGSQVKPMDTFNSVAIINLDFTPGTGAESKLSIQQNLPWSSRMGHSCVIFPHAGTDNIYLLGGVDEWGASLNDVWVSSDGKTWKVIDNKGIVKPNTTNPPMDWSPRNMAGIAVELDNTGEKSALWFGGGFSEYGGKESPDLWKWENNSWTKIAPLTISNDSYISSGLVFVGKDTNLSTGMYILGGTFKTDVNRTEGYFLRIDKKSGKYNAASPNANPPNSNFTTSSKAKVITAYFKGCLWFMVINNTGDLGITYSKLNYWIPIVTESTLILS